MRRLPANPAIPEPGDRRRGGQSAARAQGSVRSPVRTGRGVPPTAATLKAEGDVPVPWLSYRAFRLPCLDPHTSIKPASGRPGPLARNCRFFEESLIRSAGLQRLANFVDALLDAGVDDIENLRLRLAVGLGQRPHGTELLFDGLLGHLGRLGDGLPSCAMLFSFVPISPRTVCSISACLSATDLMPLRAISLALTIA